LLDSPRFGRGVSFTISGGKLHHRVHHRASRSRRQGPGQSAPIAMPGLVSGGPGGKGRAELRARGKRIHRPVRGPGALHHDAEPEAGRSTFSGNPGGRKYSPRRLPRDAGSSATDTRLKSGRPAVCEQREKSRRRRPLPRALVHRAGQKRFSTRTTRVQKAKSEGPHGGARPSSPKEACRIG